MRENGSDQTHKHQFVAVLDLLIRLRFFKGVIVGLVSLLHFGTNIA